MIVVSFTEVEIMGELHAYKGGIRMSLVLNILQQFTSTKKKNINSEYSSVVLV